MGVTTQELPLAQQQPSTLQLKHLEPGARRGAPEEQDGGAPPAPGGAC